MFGSTQFHLNGVKGSIDPLKLEYEGEEEPDFQTSLPEEVREPMIQRYEAKGSSLL